MKERFSRWDILFVQYVKRDWKKIIIWVLGLGLFSGGFVPAFKEIIKDDGAIGMFETLQNPAMIALIGSTPVTEATDYTLGAMYAHEMLLFCGIFTMVVSILHVVGHTRKEEDLGLTEIVRSFQVGRQANSLATLIETIFINIILAGFITIMMISFNMDTITIQGSLLFGASVAIAGIMGAAIALVLAQIMPYSGTATGSTLGIIGLLYIVRGVTDMSYPDFTILNPFSWIYVTYPFTENNWLPIIFAILFSFGLALLAFTLEGRRDMGAGFLPEREGRAQAKQSLLSVHGLLIYINRGTIISWLITFIVLGAAYGSIYGDMQSFLQSNDLIKLMFTESGVSIEESFTAMIIMVMICLVAILPIAIINKLFSEENRLHFSQIFATKVTRGQLYWTNVCIAVVAGAIGILLSSVGLGGAAMATMEDSSVLNWSDFLLAGYNFFPSVLFFIGLASLALGWIPRFGKFIYVYLTYSFLLNYFGNILNLPDWLFKTSIQSWSPQMPMEEFDLITFVTITLISIGLIVFGYVGYRQRDMQEGV